MWLISCTIFVFLALIEYFIVLFAIRYDKQWRKVKPKPPVSVSSHNSTSTSAAATTNLSQTSENDVIVIFLRWFNKYVKKDSNLIIYTEKAGFRGSSTCIFNYEQNNTGDTGQIFNNGRQKTWRSSYKWGKLHTTAVIT